MSWAGLGCLEWIYTQSEEDQEDWHPGHPGVHVRNMQVFRGMCHLRATGGFVSGSGMVKRQSVCACKGRAGRQRRSNTAVCWFQCRASEGV